MSALHAQEVRFRSRAGMYLPTRISAQDGVLHLRQKVGVIMTARLTLAFNERFDVVTGVTYIPAYVTFHRGERFEVGTGSHALGISTAARYWLLPPSPGMLSWEVHTTVGVAGGGQSAFKDMFDQSTMTATIATALRYQIGRIVSLSLRVQERLCRIRLGPHAPTNSRSPLDLAFGVSLPFFESFTP